MITILYMVNDYKDKLCDYCKFKLCFFSGISKEKECWKNTNFIKKIILYLNYIINKWYIKKCTYWWALEIKKLFNSVKDSTYIHTQSLFVNNFDKLKNKNK